MGKDKTEKKPARKKAPSRGGFREGAGRPKKYANAVRVNLSMPDTAVVALDEQAAAAGMNRSEYVISLLMKTKAIGQAVRDGLA